MTLRAQLIFLTVVLTLLTVLHGFIALHLLPLLPPGPSRAALVVAFLVLGTAYLVGKALELRSPRAAVPFLHAGSWWFGVMTYLFLGCLVADAGLTLWWVLHAAGLPLPALCVDTLVAAGRVWFLLLLAALVPVLIRGHCNVLFPRLRSWTFPGAVPLKIAAASDLHLCALVSPARLERIVRLIEETRPDLIVFPGDLIDEDLERAPHGSAFRALLRRLQAPLGIYAVTGNHEWINGAGPAVAWIESCGITVLRDRAVDLGPCVLAGREDAAGPRFGAGEGMPLERLLRGMDRNKPLLVLDHQPVRLREAAEAGAALVLCGHTHHGQFWPFQGITRRLFAVSWGHKKIGATDIVVSCGAGAWGPQIRTNSRSEVLSIELTPRVSS